LAPIARAYASGARRRLAAARARRVRKLIRGFRDELKRTFTAWLATRPFTNPAAPRTPFDMPQYRLNATAHADHLEAVAAADSDQAKSANQSADNYMLAVVLFASSLFFAGISTKLQTHSARVTLLTLGCLLFVGTVAWIATFPTRLT
jgi:hypothetical protein